MEPISLDTTPVPEQITLEGTQSPPLPESLAQSRASKADIGLSSITGQGYDDYYKSIQDGNEKNVRDTAASAIDYKSMEARQKGLTALAIKKGSMLSLDEVQDYINQPGANPDNVIEKAYSEKYVQSLREAAARMDSDILKDSDFDDDTAVNRFFSKGSDVLSRIEYAKTAAQNLQPEVDNSSWLNIPFFETAWTPDARIRIGESAGTDGIWKYLPSISTTLSGLTGGTYGAARQEYLLRGNTDKTSSFSSDFLLGSNLRAQADELRHAPSFDEFQTKFDAIISRLKQQSPAAAQEFASAVVGMSTNEIIAMNAQTASNALLVGGLYSTIRGVLKGIGKRSVNNLTPPRDMGDLGRGPDGTYRPNGPTEPPSGGGGTPLLTGPEESERIQAARKAVEDVLSSSPASPTKANIAEATGDLKEAASQKAVISATKPDPTRDATDVLLTIHRSNQDQIRANPGNLSREVHNRILEAGDGYDRDVVDVLKETAQVTRMPSAVEDGFREIAEGSKDYFRGRESTILDIDTIHDPVTNTHHHVYTIGNYTGEGFTSPKLAMTHARNNGYGGISLFGNDPDVVYLPPQTVLKEKTFGEPNSLYTGFINKGELTALNTAVKNGTYADNAHQFDGTLRLYTDAANKVHVQARNNPSVGDIPVSVMPKGKIKYGKPVDQLQEANPKLEIRDTNGVTTFHNDEAEILPSLNPVSGHIPFNLKTKKFGNPLPYGPMIVQKGLGYYIQWSIPVDETSPVARAGLLASPKTRSAVSESNRYSMLVNGVLGYFRDPADTLSNAENANRGVVAWAPNRYLQTLSKQYKYVKDLYQGLLDEGYGQRPLSLFGNLTGRNKQVWDDFVRALKVSQKAPDPVTKLPGYYMETPSEIQLFWRTNFGRDASIPEQEAYLAVTRLNKADLIFRSISLYKNMSRLGVMEHTLLSMPPMSNSGEIVRGTTFQGRFIREVPRKEEAIVIHDKDGSLTLLNSRNSEFRRDFDRKVKQGIYKGVQIYDPDSYPITLKDSDGNQLRVIYVFSNSIDSRPLRYDTIEYRGGGHWDYAYEHYVKQPIMRKQKIGGTTQVIYAGDSTFAPVKNSAEGVAFARDMNKVLALLRAKDIRGAKAMVQSTFDIEWKDFIKKFFPTKDKKTGQIKPPAFSIDEDFRVVPRGFTIDDMDKKVLRNLPRNMKFVDGTRQGSLARNFQVEYTGARDSYDLFVPNNSGSVSQPFYKFEPAELVDPIVTMQRALNRIVHSLAMDDYKNSAVEHWLAENLGSLNDQPQKVMAAPFWYFLNGDLTRSAKNSLRGRVAEANRYKIKQLVGMPSAFDSLMHDVKQHLSDWMYSLDASPSVGSKVTKNALVPARWALDKIHNPVNFARGMAFHENLGFWNWQQIVAQNMGYLNIVAQSSEHAIPGMFGAWMYLWSKVNRYPAILKHMGKMAETFGWKAGEWERAMEDYEKTGFHLRGHNLAMNDFSQNSFTMNLAGDILRKGTILFDLSEQNVRHGAFFAAWHEYVRAYPNRVINEVARNEILARARRLYMNMDTTSKTALDRGIMTMPLQFMKYNQQVSNTFFSKKIGDVFGKENTWQLRAKQRAKMYLIYSLAFGPLGAIGLSGIPIPDMIRKQALEGSFGVGPLKVQTTPYLPGESLPASLLMEGPASVAGAYLSGWYRTGKFDMSHGTFYNFNDRYGANGIQFWRDLLEGDQTYWKLITGAAGSTLANNLSSLSPFTLALTSAWRQEQTSPYRLTVQDWQNLVTKNIGTMRNIDRFRYAIEFGKWKDRSGRPIQDIGAIDAIFRTLTGSTDQAIDNAFLLRESLKDRQDMYARASRQYFEERARADEAAANNDFANADTYMKNAVFAILGLPPEEVAKVFAGDGSRNKNAIDKVMESYYLNRVPPDKAEAFKKIYSQYWHQRN